MLSVCEIFKSIQGESTFAGVLCAFVRLSGCNLHCTYCDTEYARHEGSLMSIEACVAAVEALDCKLVEITGGEPLMQSETPELCRALVDKGCTVLVETNGSQIISKLPSACIRIMDIKCPGSSMENSLCLGNLDALCKQDQVKFVISDKRDFAWSLNIAKTYNLFVRTTVLFSPNMGALSPKDLAEWIIQANSPARLGLQLHKVIWGNDTRGK